MEPPTPADTFHAFSRLPPELRCIIWRQAAFSRILTLRRRTQHRLRNDDGDRYFLFYDSVPAVLHTCHESRTYAPYIRAFRNVVCNADRDKSARYIWVNFELDTVRFVEEAIYLSKLHDQDCAALQHIILQYMKREEFFCDTMLELERMNNLKSIQIHVANGGLGWWSRQIGWLEDLFAKWFGREEGWVCPKILLKDLDTGFQLDRDTWRTHQHLAPNSPIRCPRAAPRHAVVRGFRGGRNWRNRRAQQQPWQRF